MSPTVITIDHPSPSNSSSRSGSFTDRSSSTGTGIHVSNTIDSQEDSDLLDDTWDPIYVDDIDLSESASRSRPHQQYRTSSQPAPSIHRGSSRRQATSDNSSHPSASRTHRSGAPTVASHEDFPAYGRGYPPQHSQHAARPPQSGYPHGYSSGYNTAPFGGAPGTVVPFGGPGVNGYPQNPFSPAGAGAPGYFPSGNPYPGSNQPSGAAYGGHEVLPYGQAGPYAGYPPYGVPHHGSGTPGSASPYYHYAVPIHPPPPPESPAPKASTPAPTAVPATAPPPPDPEIAKKLAELQKELEESRKAFNDKLAAEKKAKDDAEQAAANQKRVAEEVAKMKAEMEAAAKAKETADAKAKFDAEVAAAAKAKADEEKAKAEAAAKEKFEAELKAKYEKEVKDAKAEADAAKALVAPPDEKKKPIKFKDAVGRKFSFPFHLCQTWAGMEDLIRQAFVHLEIGPHVQAGNYDLIGPSGEIILPQVWETVIEPDWAITMHLWPLPEPEKEEKAPAAQHPGHHPGPSHRRQANKGAAKARDRERPPVPPGWLGPPIGSGGTMPHGVTMVDENVPRPKKKAGGPSWGGLFGGGGGGGGKGSKSGGNKKSKK